MSFDRLQKLCEISDHTNGYVEFVHEWSAKRHALRVGIDDLPRLVDEHKNRKEEAYSENPEITLVDPVSAIRLANGCESVSHLVYSMSELAARLANKISQTFPQSFNELRKKAAKGILDVAVTDALGDLQWYERIREIRTEWAHYSSPFVGQSGAEPSIVLRSFRSKGDRVHFNGLVSFTVDELIQWAESAFRTIDGLADYLFRHHLLRSFDYQKKIPQIVRDKNGWPIIKDGRLQTEEMTIANYMFKFGILEECATVDGWAAELNIPVERIRAELVGVSGVKGPTPEGAEAEYFPIRAINSVIERLKLKTGNMGITTTSDDIPLDARKEHFESREADAG
ncbi:MAG: hypothetical protein O2983_12375 [Planctomycetota bacterium]|nr:hypothetical protein [Planctomycetota bacterium]MDA0918288.1 hypothetical protein [Planctomycetota bacterium]MDA1160394.1 hypothetical protein [Planctomycetota bacterium]